MAEQKQGLAAKFLKWMIAKHPTIGVRDGVPLPVVAECDDQGLKRSARSMSTPGSAAGLSTPGLSVDETAV